jgi:hypothetical protein
MIRLPDTDRAVLPLGKRSAFEGVARQHGRRRNPAWMTPRSSLRTPTNQPRDNAQRWVEKVGCSVKGSDTPHMMNDSTRITHRPPSALQSVNANPSPRSRGDAVGVSGIFWLAAGLATLVLVLLLVAGVAAASAHRTASCRTNRLGVRGPTANASDVFFSETVFGCATGRANYVISGDQHSRAGGCASTYRAEMTRGEFARWPTGTGRVRDSFSLVAKFYSQNPGTHGICSYLVNRTTKQTYAHAGRFWTNS